MNKSIKSSYRDALNAAFAEKIAGWKYYPANRSSYGELYRRARWKKSGTDNLIDNVPDFVSSTDAVLPYLEKRTWRGCSYRNPRGDYFSATVEVVGPKYKLIKATSKRSFAHAAVIALLRAHGVEVIDNE